MNSIDQKQTEETQKDLNGQEAAKKIKELADKAQSCFFCTRVKSGGPMVTRPMAPLKIDEDGNLWFLSADDSHKNEELSTDPSVQLFFQGSHHSDFLMLSGKSVISRDKEKIKELWNPMIKNWFTQGQDDPRITVIKVMPDDGYYWDTRHGTLVSLVKQVAGAVTGKTMDDSVQGKLKL